MEKLEKYTKIWHDDQIDFDQTYYIEGYILRSLSLLQELWIEVKKEKLILINQTHINLMKNRSKEEWKAQMKELKKASYVIIVNI